MSEQSGWHLRAMLASDADSVLRIFAEGIATGIATFETTCPDWQGFDQRFLSSPRLVAEDHRGVIGWAVLSPFSSRACYQGVAEISVYVAQAHAGKGIGKALLQRLVELAEQQGFWTLQATILRINDASIRLHEQCGFRRVGFRERIAERNGQWLDTVLLERRRPD
ncbi:GNAT family N-acetyltransferase [Permianibacter aggregans]|uniref:Phosphinothricin acetyltransferase n=1 Tax=Permianibacter aggregans TaxID=1510150 RepID=A0A4R6UG64_9GAMM|nr:GNAT family N-acetyltransferase [Permianibacter aggregans]TDQ45800.1 phosphinothricin acetyltransferase [Permianibacter aggregans]